MYPSFNTFIPVSPYQIALIRILLGSLLAYIGFEQLLQVRASLNQVDPGIAFWNLLALSGSILLGIFLTMGFLRRVVCLLLCLSWNFLLLQEAHKMEPNHYWLSILLIGFVILPKGDVIRPPIHLWNSDHDPSKNWQFPKIVHDSAWWGFGILGVAISLSESFHHPLLMGFYFSFTLPAVVPFLRKAFWAIALIGFFWQSIAFESVSVDWGAYLYLLFLWNPQWLKPSKDTADQLNIVFFDGDCLICNRSVRFLMREDRLRQLKFAPLQGNTFKRFYPEMATDLDFDSMVFSPHSENPSASPKQRTSAIAAMLMAMGGFWRVIGILLFLIPTPIRDLGYNLIAQNRYRWFGKTKTFCEMPKQEDISRLLD